MNRLNPFDKADTILSSFFPPNEDFYADIQGEGFKRFLLSDATTDDGQKAIAMFYNVYNEWTQSTGGSDTINNYYKLLLLVKTKSKKENVWISFVEGLHRHAAIITCLLCTKFDYKTISSSLDHFNWKTSKKLIFHIIKILGIIQKNV
jgi:hypothetical protein